MPYRTFHAARLERIRCAAARLLFRTTAATAELSTAAAPKHHPWRLLIGSALDDLQNLTEATLNPRGRNGAAAAKVKTRRVSLKYVLATYLIVAQFVPLLPAVVLYHGEHKLYPLAKAGITETPVIAPRLRVYVTPRNVDLDRAPERPIPADR